MTSPTEATDQPVLRLRNISKSFPNVKALDDVSIDVFRGQVLALMGENGAGKSTLLKILAGVYRPDTGHIELEGSPVSLSNPSVARASGVRIVHQEPEIMDHVDVAENVLIGALPSARFSRGAIRRMVGERIKDIGFGDRIRSDLMGLSLSPAQRQMVEILRALEAGAKVVCFDEPTSSLTDEEVDELFKLIARLREEGVAVIYVSHRMGEIFRVADRIAVLRDGQLVLEGKASDLDEDAIVHSMVGRDVAKLFPRAQAPVADPEPALSVRNLVSQWHKDISFEIHRGEIVGFAGLVGAGRSELAKVIYGELPKQGGSVVVEGEEVDIQSPTKAMSLGLGLGLAPRGP